MNLQKLNEIFSVYSDYQNLKFDKLVEYLDKAKLLNEGSIKTFVDEFKIRNLNDFKNNFDNFLNFCANLVIEDKNISKLAIHLIKKHKVTIKDFLIKKKNIDYLFKEWFDSLPIEQIEYSKNQEETDARLIKQLKKPENISFKYYQNLKPKNVYIVKDDCDFIHLIDNGSYIKKSDEKIYGSVINTIIDSDFKNSISFGFLKSKNLEFCF